MDQSRLEHLVDYIKRHEGHLSRYLRPLFDPKDKRILVIGSGWGTETYWSLINGASYVLGVDPATRPIEPVVAALNDSGHEAKFEHRLGSTAMIEASDGPFDAIISNNVFEHISDVAGVLRDCRRLMPNSGNRLHIFTDPLYYSSVGAHLPLLPWEHLTASKRELEVNPNNQAAWAQYETGLNCMTITDFLHSVRDSGMWIEKLSIVPDRNRSKFTDHANDLPPHYKPMDLMLEGISCTLAFPENI